MVKKLLNDEKFDEQIVINKWVKRRKEVIIIRTI